MGKTDGETQVVAGRRAGKADGKNGQKGRTGKTDGRERENGRTEKTDGERMDGNGRKKTDGEQTDGETRVVAGRQAGKTGGENRRER